MKKRHRNIFLSLLLVVLTALMIGGCGKAADTGSSDQGTPPAEPAQPAAKDPGVEVAIVPEADLLFYLDLADMRATPIMQALRDRRETQGDTAPAQMNEADWSKIKELTGLDDEDLLTVVVSADLNAIDIQATRVYEQIKQLRGACAIALAKPLSYDKVAQSMRVMLSRSAKSQFEEIELAERPVARVVPTSTKEPIVYATVSASARTLLITFDESVMEAMLERDSNNAPATPNAELVRLGSKIAEGTQIQLMVLANDTMRARIAEGINSMADPNPQQHQSQKGILAGFLSPLKNTQNVVLGTKAVEALDMRLAIELGNASEAQQCAHLIQSFIVPMMMKSFDTIDPDNKIQADNTFMVMNEDNTLIFTLQVTQQDVANWQ